MPFKLLTFVSFVAAAIAAPSLQFPSSHHLNCNFTLHLTEHCLSSPTPALTTSAALTTILSPWGNAITNYTEGLDIDSNPLSVYASRPQESIAGTLDVQRPNNTAVKFGWTYGPSGGRPVTERWSEEEEGTEGRYGCVVRRDWDGPGASCDGARPTGEREKLLDCWFKCNGVADSET